jgi:hypothetical protein
VVHPHLIARHITVLTKEINVLTLATKAPNICSSLEQKHGRTS